MFSSWCGKFPRRLVQPQDFPGSADSCLQQRPDYLSDPAVTGNPQSHLTAGNLVPQVFLVSLLIP